MGKSLKINDCMEKLWVKGATNNEKTSKLEKGEAIFLFQ